MEEIKNIKGNLHLLIDKLEDKELLEIAYQILNSKNSNKEGELISNLTDSQKKELYQSYEDSFDETKLIDLGNLKGKHGKWLEK